MSRDPLLRIAVRRRTAAGCGALAALLLAGLHAQPLSTEQLTMTTYYPAPYGVYKTMRVTDDAHLAYTTGNVGIGTLTPSGKLHVTGTGNVILNTSGNLGVGTNNPLAKVHFAGTGGNMLFDATAGMVTVGTTDTSQIYVTGIKLAQSNMHVQGNENNAWLRVGDA